MVVLTSEDNKGHIRKPSIENKANAYEGYFKRGDTVHHRKFPNYVRRDPLLPGEKLICACCGEMFAQDEVYCRSCGTIPEIL